MKEKSFRFRESYSQAVKAMNDKQAGKFLKALCDYAFDGKILESNDSTLKSSFTLAKYSLDESKRNSENGRKGGIVCAEIRRKEQLETTIFGSKKGTLCPLDDIIKTMLSIVENEEDEEHPTGRQSVEK